MLIVTDVSKRYGETVALQSVKFDVAPGACVALVGPMGSGKTTFQKLLLGEEEPTTGFISVDGHIVAQLPPAMLRTYRSRVGSVTAKPLLLPHLSVLENIQLPLTIHSQPVDMDEAEFLLRALNIHPYRNAKPESLDRATAMLTCIARACIVHPAIIVLDEPFAELSLHATAAAVTLLLGAAEEGTSVMLLTRNANHAALLHAQEISLSTSVSPTVAHAE